MSMQLGRPWPASPPPPSPAVGTGANGSARQVDADAASLAQAALDTLAQGVAVLDVGGRLRYWNLPARQVLTEAGWQLDHGTLQHVSLEHNTTLLRALARVCTQGLMQLLPLHGAQGHSHAGLVPLVQQDDRLAMLVLGRSQLCGAIELQLYASASELTHAESRVLHQLVAGLQPAQIAEQHAVAVSTVLSQVAALRAKTRCASVRQLLARLARLPALRPALISSRRSEPPALPAD